MILVVGGAGYIGSHTVAQLLGRGEKVVVLDDLSTGHRWAVPHGVSFEQGNLGDVQKLDQIFAQYPIDSVIHFAALLDVEESTRLPDRYYENNFVFALRLADACRRHKVKHFVFSSTCAVYGTPDHNPVGESTPVQPVSTYGKSKAAFEWYLQDLGAAGILGMSTVLLRYFNVAGASRDGKNGQVSKRATQLVTVLAEVASGKRPELKIYGTDYPTHDGTCIRDYIHVEDLATLHVLSLDYLRQGGKSEVFNCGYGKGYSVKDVAEAFKKASGVDFKIVMAPRRAGDSVAIFADPAKVKSALRWEPRENLETICKSAWNWEMNGKKKVLESC